MPNDIEIIIRRARPEDIYAISEIDLEAFSPYGTVEEPETFRLRLQTFPEGFIVLLRENELIAYGCSEKWLIEREPGLDENPMNIHQAEGRIFCITAMAVRSKYRGNGYGLSVLDNLIEIARAEGCLKIVLETTHAQRLYVRRGFEVVNRRNERGVDLDVMAKNLLPNSRA